MVLWGKGSSGVVGGFGGSGVMGQGDVGQASTMGNGGTGRHGRGVSINYGQNMKKCGILP